MSKYSVNGTEVISDAGTIDWTKIKNAPIIYGPQTLAVVYTNCLHSNVLDCNIDQNNFLVIFL